MTEYLEKAALVRILRAKAEMGRLSEYSVCFDNVAKMIELLPAADVAEVKHGKWIQEQIKIENMSIVRYRNTCSECGGKADFLLRDLHYSYCPHCGAKMDLED